MSRTRPAKEAVAVAEKLDQLVAMGSSGAKAMAIIRGEADNLPPLGRPIQMGQRGPGRRGSSARPALFRIDGSALRYNSEDVYCNC